VDGHLLRRKYAMAKEKKPLLICIKYLFGVFWTYQKSVLNIIDAKSIKGETSNEKG
jgi:hypothetical protein